MATPDVAEQLTFGASSTTPAGTRELSDAACSTDFAVFPPLARFCSQLGEKTNDLHHILTHVDPTLLKEFVKMQFGIMSHKPLVRSAHDSMEWHQMTHPQGLYFTRPLYHV